MEEGKNIIFENIIEQVGNDPNNCKNSEQTGVGAGSTSTTGVVVNEGE